MFGQQASCPLYTPKGRLIDSDPRPPVTTFEINTWGHVVLRLYSTRHRAPGRGDVLRDLLRKGIKVSEPAVSMFLSPEYKEQCVENGTTYRVVIVPNRDIESRFRTLRVLYNESQRIGYGPAFAGMVADLSQVVTAKDLGEMGIWYINIPHLPIPDVDGQPSIFSVHRNGGVCVGGCQWYPDEPLDEAGACVFLC